MTRAAGAAAALAWVALCVIWFTPASQAPAWLASCLASVALAGTVAWLVGRRGVLLGPDVPPALGTAALVGALAFAARLPLARHGALGYLTPDGALSGIVAPRVLHGAEHFVFVPHVPYSGSLKSHLTAGMALLGLDPAQAFALASIAFYAAFAAGVAVLAWRQDREGGGAGRAAALGAGLWTVLAPAFVTRYSLSNDGNYVEVLAFGAWALVLARRWLDADAERPTVALATGLLLGFAFWCHILAFVYGVAIAAAWLVLGGPRRTLRQGAAPGLAGFALGYAPGLLWNAVNDWESFHYLLPGGPKVGTLAEGPGLAERIGSIVRDQWPVLVGYDPGYPGPLDTVFLCTAWSGVAVVVVATLAAAVRCLAAAETTVRLLCVFTAVNLAIAFLALPYIPGNPRYLLFLMTALPVFVARGRAWPLRAGLALLLLLGLLGSALQAPGAFRSDGEWRAFVAGLDRLSVRTCTTDFFLATKLTFASSERIVCSAKLGPTTSEYFFEYRTQVEQAARVALIAVNPTAADKLARRLERLGVAYERHDLMKPVLVPTRAVDPAEIWPDRSFPLR